MHKIEIRKNGPLVPVQIGQQTVAELMIFEKNILPVCHRFLNEF